MKLAIVCVGKLKEKYFREAAAEYAKRLARFGGVEIIECPDSPEPKNASPADIDKIVRHEGEIVLAKLGARDEVVALAIGGARMDSEALAGVIKQWEDRGAHRVVFIIGGSNGLSAEVLSRANARLSLSPMTFPHQLARVMLLEQLFRARKILAGEAYHK